jgi:cysteine peptidase B
MPACPLPPAAELSLKNPSATFGMNKFSDLHPVEFKKQYLNFVPALGDSAILRERAPIRKSHKHAQSAVPTSYDWRTPDQGRPVGVTAVKDQGQCGSCWAFSATEELESAWILAGNPMAELAPQQTVDCDTVDQGVSARTHQHDSRSRIGTRGHKGSRFLSLCVISFLVQRW